MSQLPTAVWVAAAAGLASVALFAWVIAVPAHKVPVARRRHGVDEPESLVARATDRVVGGVGVILSDGKGRRLAYALDRAGVRRTPAEFVVIAAGFSLSALVLGYFVGGLLLGVLVAVLVPIMTTLVVVLRSDRRKRAFADDLDDILSLLATNLRAGHSLVQSLDTVAREIEDPARTELARVVNQVRIGRDLGEATVEAADRMDSDEFRWVAQAIAIHRQVGGNLGEVLDTVGLTIRERNRLQRQVRALSAEGRLSAWVLVALPVVVATALAFMNPAYLQVLVDSPVGIAMTVVAVILMGVGGLWLRSATRVEF